MKKMLLLSLALGLAGTASLSAGTVEVFLTGSTAFRANVYNACLKCFNTTPTVYYGDAAHGGDANNNSKTAAWVMIGNPLGTMTNLYTPGTVAGTTLKIHGLFTGSVQGLATVEQSTPLSFPDNGSGSSGTTATSYVTNIPTIGFSDCESPSTPYNVANISGYAEETVAIQPFIWCISVSDVTKTNIANISTEQAFYGIPNGLLPLSAWTGRATDASVNVYFAERTKDSGTRRVETACANYSFNDQVGIYIWDATNKFWYLPTSGAVVAKGGAGAGIVGPAGLNNANTNWGYGYVGGGDVRTALADATNANVSVGILSFADAQSFGGSTSNWSQTISYNGIWPTTAGAGIRGNTVTNDFSPIKNGYYPLWAEETIVYSTAQSTLTFTGGSKITDSQLGNGTTPGTFLGVFNAHNQASPVAGSIDNEIFISQSTGGVGYPATEIRLGDMKCNRSTVGGIISPY